MSDETATSVIDEPRLAWSCSLVGSFNGVSWDAAYRIGEALQTLREQGESTDVWRSLTLFPVASGTGPSYTGHFSVRFARDRGGKFIYLLAYIDPVHRAVLLDLLRRGSTNQDIRNGATDRPLMVVMRMGPEVVDQLGNRYVKALVFEAAVDVPDSLFDMIDQRELFGGYYQ